MSILDDIKDAIAAYPHERLTLAIVDVNPPGNVIDDEDDVTFRISVTNAGTLDVDDLTVLVGGLNGTQVKANGAAAQWVSSFTYSGGSFDHIPAHQPNAPILSDGGLLHFKPKSPSTLVRDLVRITVSGWNTNFNHMQVAHSEADTAASAVYRSTVSGT